jgi:hypothetical protein
LGPSRPLCFGVSGIYGSEKPRSLGVFRIYSTELLVRVVQEAALARDLVVRCGSFEISWDFLKEKIERFRWIEPLCAFSEIANCRQDYHRGTSEELSALNYFGRRKCYDPRDVIFAVRSILPALALCIPE